MADEKSPLTGKTAHELLDILRVTPDKETRIDIIREIGNTWDILAITKLEEILRGEKDEDIAQEIRLSIDAIRTANSQEENLTPRLKQNALPLETDVEQMEAIVTNASYTLVLCFFLTVVFWLFVLATMNGFAIGLWVVIGFIALMIDIPNDVQVRFWIRGTLCMLFGPTALVFIILRLLKIIRDEKIISNSSISRRK